MSANDSEASISKNDGNTSKDIQSSPKKQVSSVINQCKHIPSKDLFAFGDKTINFIKKFVHRSDPILTDITVPLRIA